MKQFTRFALLCGVVSSIAISQAVAGPLDRLKDRVSNQQSRVSNQKNAANPLSPVQINVSQTGFSTLKQGVLNGPNNYANPTPALNTADTFLSALKFGSWRFSGIREYGYGGDIYKFVVEDYRYKARFSTETVFNLQDIFNAKYGKPITVSGSCRPRQRDCFSSFASLQSAWRQELGNFLNATKYADITYFDLLAEANHNAFVGVTVDQRYALLKDAYALVRQIRPDAKIVGPSNAGFSPKVYEGFVSYLVRDGLRLDAISWHDFGSDPSIVVTNAHAMRTIFQKYPAICQPKCPELHVNEYEGEETMFIPGYAVGWLSNLELARVDHANRACWGGDPGSPIPYQSCWEGFSGLLTPDNLQPQPLYWVYKFYADLNGSRFGVSNLPARTSVISGKLGDGKIGILVGNYGNRQGMLSMQLVGFNASAGDVAIHKIPNMGNRVSALPRVDAVQNITVPAQNAMLTVNMNEFQDGGAYWIVVTPR